jgi:hypothetical protein
MTDEESKEIKDDSKKKKKKDGLPFCTTAPSAEHSRGHDEEEPCDDFREGK